MAIFFIYISPFLVPQPGQAGTKKYLPPRHKYTKDFILLFFLSVLVPWWREEKVFVSGFARLEFGSFYFAVGF